jgi:predicted RNA-binding Zn-ribbon protein involved in translation (DUF1610 family)
MQNSGRPTARTVLIVCAACGTKVADAVPGSLAKCPNCGVWSGTTIRPRLTRQSPADEKARML